MKFHILTVATEPGGGLEALATSAKLANVEFTCLGVGAVWENYCTKLKLVCDYLLKQRESELSTTFYFFCDAYDVVFDWTKWLKVANSEKLFNLVDPYQIILSAVNLDKRSLFYKYLNHKSIGAIHLEYNNLNSFTCNPGLYGGWGNFLRDFLFDLITNAPNFSLGDDERVLNEHVKQRMSTPYEEPKLQLAPIPYIFLETSSKTYLKVGIDVEKRLFYNVLNESFTTLLRNVFEIGHTKLDRENINNVCMSDAYFYHFCGNQSLNKICSLLKLPAPLESKNTLGKRFLHYFKFFQTEVVIILVMLLVFLYFKTK